MQVFLYSRSYDKLACLANDTEVFIVDTVTLEVVQVLTGHTSTISHVLWLPAGRQFVSAESKLSNRDIVSADSTGQVIVWDALKGQQVGTFSHPDGSRTILDMLIPYGSDLWVRTKIYILYSGNMLTIFDYVHGSSQFVPISNPTMENLGVFDQFVRFCSDPYHASQYSSSLAFYSLDGTVSLCKFWDCVKDTKIMIHKRVSLTGDGSRISGPGGTTTGNSPSSQMSKSTSLGSLSSNLNQIDSGMKRQIPSSSSIRKLVSDIIVGPDYSSSTTSGGPQSKFPGSITFHPGVKDTVIVSTDVAIYFLNIHFMTVLHTFSIDKQVAPIVQVIPTKSRPCLFTLHENGTIYVRKYVISGEHSMAVQLETVCYEPRFSGKKIEVVGFVVNPFEENSVIVYLNDGRLLKYALIAMKSTPVPGDVKPHLTTPSTPFVHNIGVAAEEQRDDQQNKKLLPGSPNKHCRPLASVVKSILDVETDTSLSIQLQRVTHAFGQFTCIKSQGDILVGTLSAANIALY